MPQFSGRKQRRFPPASYGILDALAHPEALELLFRKEVKEQEWYSLELRRQRLDNHHIPNILRTPRGTADNKYLTFPNAFCPRAHIDDSAYR